MTIGILRKLLRGESEIRIRKTFPQNLRRESRDLSGQQQVKQQQKKNKYAIDHFLPRRREREKNEGIRHDCRQPNLK